MTTSFSKKAESSFFPQKNKIVHRKHELELLKSKFSSASEHKGSILFFEGQAGIGKTKTINYFIENLPVSETVILVGGAQHLHTPPPYHAIKKAITRFMLQDAENFYDALKKLDETHILQFLQFIPELNIERLPEFSFLKPSKQFESALFEAILHFFSHLSEKKTLVLCLEDFQDADFGTWQFLKFLNFNLDRKNILVIINIREFDFENESHSESLKSVFFELKNSPLVYFHKFKPFDLQVTSDYCSEFKFFKRLPPKGIEFIFNLTKGNPLYIVEIAKYLISSPRLIEKIEQGTLALEGFDIPSTIQDVVLAELKHLSAEERDFARFLSVLGFEISVEVVRTVTSQSSEQLHTLLDKLKARNVIVDSNTEGTSHKIQFSHPMIRTVIYNEMQTKKRRGFHLQIADQMEKYIDYSVDLVLLADHFFLAGDWTKSYKYAIACALQAKQVYAYDTAYQFFSRAREIAKFTSNTDAFAEMVQKEGEMLESLGRYSEAYKRLSQSAKIMEKKADHFGVANNFLLMAKIHHVQGEFQDSLKLLKKAKSLISDNVALYGLILGEECWIYRILGDYQQSLDSGNKALEILGKSAPKRETGLVYNNLAEIYYRMGDYKTAETYFIKRLEISKLIGDKPSEAMSLNNIGELKLAFDKVNESREQIEKAVLMAREISTPETLARVLSTCAVYHYEVKDIELSQTTLDEVFSISDLSNYQYIRPQLYILRSRLYLAENDFENALKHAKSALNLSAKSKSIEFQGLSYQVLGDIYFAKSDLESATLNYKQSVAILEKINLLQLLKSQNKLALCYQQTKKTEDYKTLQIAIEQVCEKLKTA